MLCSGCITDRKQTCTRFYAKSRRWPNRSLHPCCAQGRMTSSLQSDEADRDSTAHLAEFGDLPLCDELAIALTHHHPLPVIWQACMVPQHESGLRIDSLLMSALIRCCCCLRQVQLHLGCVQLIKGRALSLYTGCFCLRCQYLCLSALLIAELCHNIP